MITGHSIPSRRCGVLDYRLADETVIYDAVTSQAASLNGSASMIWELCDGTRSVHALCLEIAQRFDVSADEIDGSIRDGVERLCELGLICV